jgi:hypothetical protein
LLREQGYSASLNQDQRIELTDAEALRHPEGLATLLVHAGLPPKTLYRQEEDLESYFLRLIQAAPPRQIPPDPIPYETDAKCPLGGMAEE